MESAPQAAMGHHRGDQRFMKNAPFTATLLLAAAALLGACSPTDKASTEPTIKVERQPFTVDINELGVIASTRVVQLNAPYSGRIIKILESGTPVKKDDVVVILDTREQVDDLESRIDELKQIKADLERTVEDLRMSLRGNALDLSSSQAQLDLQRVQLEQVNLDLSELEFLRSRQIVPQEDVRDGASKLRSTQINTLTRDMTLRGDLARSQSTESSKQIELERIGLRGTKARARVDEVQERIRNAEIKAPVDGLFLRHSRWNWQNRRNTERENGETVRFSEPLGTIPDLSTLVVQSQIPEGDVMRVNVGTEVSLIFEALGNLEIPGTISKIAPLAIERETSPGGRITAGGQELTGERVFEVEITMQRQDPRLKPGLTARTRIQVAREENMIALPLKAIQSNGGNHYVVIRNGERHQQRTVSLGLVSGDMVQVLIGINEGDEVILRPSLTKRPTTQ